MRILLAEDDDVLSDGIAKALADSSFTVDRVKTGADADLALATSQFDLAILDLGLPLLDGIEVLRKARSRGNWLPVLILTARSRLEDRLTGLNAGADDYLSKPFDLPELEARVRVLIRRAKSAGESKLRFGPISFDISTSDISINDEPADFSARELSILEILLQRAGRVVSKEHLIENVCGWDSVTANAIEVYIHRVRKKLEPHGVSIRAVRGLGYVLEQKPCKD
jgi:two-component system OmpR family response regulator